MILNATMTSLAFSNASEAFNDPEDSQSYVNTRRMQTVLLPVVCTVGLVGNSLAVRTFFSAGLRTSSCSLYLAAKCLADNGFLLALGIVWLYRIQVPLLNVQGVCQLTVFLSYTCGFLSVWFVAIITCENYVRIAHVGHVSMYCTATRALYVIGVVTLLAVALNGVHLWITRVVDHQGSAECVTTHQQVLVAMTCADTVLTLLLPSLCILFMVLVIANHVVQAQRRRKRLRAGTQRAHGIRRQQTPQVKMTRFLLAISLIFLVLHTPGHVIRIKMIVCLYVFDRQPTSVDLIFHRVFELLFFLNFCNNCLIYLLFGDNFRSTFTSIFRVDFRKHRLAGYHSEKHGLVQSDITELVAV